MFKNIIIAALATVIYHANIVPETEVDVKILATTCAFLFTVVLMDSFDSMLKNKRRRKVHMLTDKAFANYKTWLNELLQEKAHNRDEAFRENLVMNVIKRNKRYAFSGKQIEELLNLARDEEEENARNGKVCS